MTRNLIFLGLWAVLPTPGQVATAALYTEFQHHPPPAVLQAIREEVALLLAPNGLHFEWRSLPETDSSVWPELAVLTFTGRCEVIPLSAVQHRNERLGWTHLSNKAILPFAEVDCDAILEYIYGELGLKPPQMREQILGRAIGRVTAHELLHVFSRTPGHGNHGVDRPTLTVAQLLVDRMEFDASEPAIHILQLASTPLRGDQLPAPDGYASYVRSGCANCHGSMAEGTRHGPKLRVLGRILNSVILAAKLAKNEDKMCRLARDMKLEPPSLDENQISDLVRFLNGL
jgi:hypothetical protein